MSGLQTHMKFPKTNLSQEDDEHCHEDVHCSRQEVGPAPGNEVVLVLLDSVKHAGHD